MTEEFLTSFLLQTIMKLVARNAAGYYTNQDGLIQLELDIDGHRTTRVAVDEVDAKAFMANPTSEASIDLIEFVTNEIGITMDEITFAEELYELHESIGATQGH